MMVKTIIIAVVLIALILIALGIKLFFNKNAELPFHSCALEEGELDKDGACVRCELKDLVDCPENADNKQPKDQNKN